MQDGERLFINYGRKVRACTGMRRFFAAWALPYDCCCNSLCGESKAGCSSDYADRQVVSLKTFCKFVGELERSPKDVIMLVGKDITLTEHFKAEGIITPESEARPENPQNGSLNQSTEDGDGAENGAVEDLDDAEMREIAENQDSEGRAAGGGGIDDESRFAQGRRFGSLPSKFSPNKFMGGVTKRSTHIKPYLEAYNRYTTAERRRLRGDPVTSV